MNGYSGNADCNEMVKDNRINWVDALKGFAIFLVFLGHTNLSNNNLQKYIYSFHIPLFFLISGLFFQQKQISQGFLPFIVQKVKTRLIPYISFGLITYFIWLPQMILKRHGIYQGLQPATDNLYRPLIGMVYGIGANDWLIHNANLWFLPCLFVTEILYFCSQWITTRLYVSIFFAMVLSLIGYLDSIYLSIRLPFGFDVALTAFVFYSVGYMSRDYLLYRQLKIQYALLCFTIGIIASYYNSRIDMMENHYGNYILFYLAALSNIYVYIYIFKISPSNKIIKYIGKNSIPIFLLQTTSFLAVKILIYIVSRTRPSIGVSIPWGIAYSVVSIVLLIPISHIITMKWPFMVGSIKTKTTKN
jgi:acyltransferase